VELLLGVPLPGENQTSNNTASQNTSLNSTLHSTMSAGMTSLFNGQVLAAISAASPILTEIGVQLNVSDLFGLAVANQLGGPRDSLVTQYASKVDF